MSYNSKMSDSPKAPLVPEGRRELLSILNRGFESKDLDYKGPCKWDEGDKKVCCALIKDILAMANTLGGLIVTGVSENASGFSLDGLSPEHNASFDTSRVNRFMQNYSDPPVNALLKKIEQDGKMFAVIEVPRFPDTPHICQEDFPGVLNAGTLYVRSDNNESVAIRSSADFRLIIEQAIRNRSESLLSAMRAILKSGSIVALPDESALAKFSQQREDAVNSFDAQNPLKDKKYPGYREVSFF
jgi:predicted HTH transcriptional regulator